METMDPISFKISYSFCGGMTKNIGLCPQLLYWVPLGNPGSATEVWSVRSDRIFSKIELTENSYEDSWLSYCRLLIRRGCPVQEGGGGCGHRFPSSYITYISVSPRIKSENRCRHCSLFRVSFTVLSLKNLYSLCKNEVPFGVSVNQQIFIKTNQ